MPRKKKKYWYIESYERIHGEIFEFIVSKEFYVRHKKRKRPVFVYFGEKDYTSNYEYGVDFIELFEENGYMIINYFDGKTEKVNLPKIH